MYVIFPVSVRAGLDLRNRYAAKGGFSAVVIKLRLPDGRIYGQDGKLDYVSPTVAENTDTITLRGVIPNPVLPGLPAGQPGPRELVDGEFVTVLLEGVQPITVLAIPRAAVLSDQQGDYVYVVDAQNKAQIRRIQLGQSTPSTAVVTQRAQGRRAGHQRGAAARSPRRGGIARAGEPAAGNSAGSCRQGSVERRRQAPLAGDGAAARQRRSNDLRDLRRSPAAGGRHRASSSRSPGCWR